MRKLWEVQKIMWDHRNASLHNKKSGVHEKKLMVIHAAIKFELAIGTNGVEEDHRHFFEVSVKEIMKSTTIINCSG